MAAGPKKITYLFLKCVHTVWFCFLEMCVQVDKALLKHMIDSISRRSSPPHLEWPLDTYFYGYCLLLFSSKCTGKIGPTSIYKLNKAAMGHLHPTYDLWTPFLTDIVCIHQNICIH